MKDHLLVKGIDFLIPLSFQHNVVDLRYIFKALNSVRLNHLSLHRQVAMIYRLANLRIRHDSISLCILFYLCSHLNMKNFANNFVKE